MMIFVCGKSWKSEIPFLYRPYRFGRFHNAFLRLLLCSHEEHGAIGWAVLIRSDTETETETGQSSQSVGRSCVQGNRRGDPET